MNYTLWFFLKSLVIKIQPNFCPKTFIFKVVENCFQIYLRPNPQCPLSCPMPCPPKIEVMCQPPTPRRSPHPPTIKSTCNCPPKRLPCLPCPPPTAPVNSPCRPHICSKVFVNNFITIYLKSSQLHHP